MTEKTAEHEYVDLMLDIKNGEIVSCEFFGEGRQVEPLHEPMLLRPLAGEQFPRGWKQIERRLRRKLAQVLGEGDEGK